MLMRAKTRLSFIQSCQLRLKYDPEVIKPGVETPGVAPRCTAAVMCCTSSRMTPMPTSGLAAASRSAAIVRGVKASASSRSGAAKTPRRSGEAAIRSAFCFQKVSSRNASPSPRCAACTHVSIPERYTTGRRRAAHSR